MRTFFILIKTKNIHLDKNGQEIKNTFNLRQFHDPYLTFSAFRGFFSHRRERDRRKEKIENRRKEKEEKEIERGR